MRTVAIVLQNGLFAKLVVSSSYCKKGGSFQCNLTVHAIPYLYPPFNLHEMRSTFYCSYLINASYFPNSENQVKSINLDSRMF
jgi:hypothetical protein